MMYLDEFQHYLADTKSASQNTIISYTRDIERFCDFILKQGCASPLYADSDMIKKYMNFLELSGRSPSTTTRSLASLRSFYQYMILAHGMAENPARAIRPQKVQKKLPQVLTGAEIELLLSQPATAELKGCRDKAMLELLYATGIRVSELINLNVEDINLEVGVLCCHGTKSERVIPIYPTAVAAIADYMARARSVLLSIDTDNALFINLNGQRMTRQGFWKLVKTYAAGASIHKDITPHTLRHSFASHLLENGAHLKDLQEILGHADISSTKVYAKVLQERFKSVYNNCHPRAKRA